MDDVLKLLKDTRDSIRTAAIELENTTKQIENIGRTFGIYQGDMGMTESVFRQELFLHLVYLAQSDGVITSEEVNLMDYLCDMYFSIDDIKDVERKEPNFREKHRRTVPPSMQVAYVIDKFGYATNKYKEPRIEKLIIQLYKAVSETLLICDGQITENEAKESEEYIKLLENYQIKMSSDLNGTQQESNMDTQVTERIRTTDFEGNDEKSLSDCINELNSLVGLEKVKDDVNSIIHLQRINKIRKERNLKEIPISNHLVFVGNPGTGKTTVARLLSRIYKHLGVLTKGQLVEVDRSGLIAGYVGQTALKVKDVVESALGGVLFIDEAYSLVSSDQDNDFGREAIDTLIKSMEDHRKDFIVIVAGYPDLMDKFINSNPGLKSRFNKYIVFDDYSTDEMVMIFNKMCKDNGYILTDEAQDYIKKLFALISDRKPAHFSNARHVRNLFEKVLVKQADRLAFIDNPSDQELITLTINDFDIY